VNGRAQFAGHWIIVGLAPATEDGLDSSSSGSGEGSANGIFFSIGDTPREKKEQPRGRNHSFLCSNQFKLQSVEILVCSRLHSFEKGVKGLGGTQEVVSMNGRKSRHRQ
jgi:hypothetical protein